MQSEDYKKIELAIKNFLKSEVPVQDKYNESYFYSVLPAGKLFRPLLCRYIHKDLCDSYNKNIDHLMIAIELHHAYTLVHDDLPSMDNDDFRRGKASCHKQFGEWIAILTGDGLLNLSYKSLSNLESIYLPSILKLFSHQLGPKGLIQGQVLDLEGNGNNLENILEIHALKTSKLLEVCTLGTLWISNFDFIPRQTTDFMKIGRKMGLIFQILDDLGELCDSKLSSHESSVNTFFIDYKRSFEILNALNTDLEGLFKRYKLNATKEFFNSYLKKSYENIKKGQSQIVLHIPKIENDLNNFLV